MIKISKFYPYHIQLHQELLEVDYYRWLEFCLWMLEKIEDDENFLDYVLFSDESTFHNHGLINRHIFHYYSDDNPNSFRTLNRQHRWSVNVWGRIVGKHVTGPYFFDGHLNEAMFLQFIKYNLAALLENISINIRQRLWLQLNKRSRGNR